MTDAPCLHCNEPIARRTRAGQPSKVHDHCRDEYRLIKNRLRCERNRAKADERKAEKVNSLPSDGSHRIKKRCGLCYGITDRRPITGCPRCAQPYQKETIKCDIITASGWTW
jgi:transposase InsO family protein